VVLNLIFHLIWRSFDDQAVTSIAGRHVAALTAVDRSDQNMLVKYV
jgi:hypothetical protein